MKTLAIAALAVMVIGWIMLASSLVTGLVWSQGVGLLLVLFGGVGAVVTAMRHRRKVRR
jgi:hypothetical protein